MIFIAVIAFIAAIAAFTYLCAPGSWHKGVAAVVFVLLCGGAFAIAVEAAGRPKPIAIEWRELVSLPVVGFVKDEESQVIYFWVMRDGVPVSYAYPWSDKAEGLQDLWRARGQYTGMTLTGDDKEAVVRPEENLPPKDLTQ